MLPGRLFADVVRSLPPGEVRLELRSEQRDVEIAGGGARFHLRTLPAEDFPRLPELEGETVRLPGGPLAETIDLVARAASRDEVRPILTGVLRAGGGRAADDGRHRLVPAQRQARDARVGDLAAAGGERAGPGAA